MSLSSLLQFQIIKEPYSEEHLVNARCKLSMNSLHMTSPEITKVMFNQLVELRGIEPRTSCVQGRRSPSWAITPWLVEQQIIVNYLNTDLIQNTEIWWVWVDLNHRPHPYQGCALTNWATDPLFDALTHRESETNGTPLAYCDTTIVIKSCV